ncbi:MAG: hypothetical protein II877_03490 [Synergistaceae bacterium]|nr:hypothetical protein [Synergistaceae bacterium]
MSDFTKGKWSYSMYMKRGILSVIRLETDSKKLGILCGLKDENEANARLIAVAPEMHKLLEEFCKIHDMKAHSKREDNSPAFMMALMAEDGAVNMARQLLACIDGKKVNHD